jgi:hypothetical protein
MTEEEARKKRRRERVVGGIDATAGMLQNAGSALLGAASFGTNLVMPYLKGLEANAVEQYNINKAQPSYSGDKGFMKLGGMIRKYPMGGQVPYEQDTPIQTEKGEKIISGAHVYDVKAKEKHEQMEEDVVTDILKGGDFIVSDRKTMSIDRAAADNMIVGTPIPFYSEHAYLPMEQPHTLGDIFGKKKKLTPADIAQRIKNKFPLSEREDDALSSHADELNLQNRIAYLEALKQLNVDNIPKAEEAEIEQMIADEAEVPQFKHGGHVRKYQNGGDPTNPPKGIKPYVTSDPNDPRIQAYRDSLTMSNLGKADPFLKLADNIPNLTKREYLRKQEALFNSRPFTEKHAQARDRLNKYNPSGVEPLSTTRFNKISKDGVEIYGAVSEWKNPQQEVIYRENTPPLAPLDTLQPQQLPRR